MSQQGSSSSGPVGSLSSTSSIAIPIFTAVLGALLSFFASYVQFGRSIGSLEARMPAIEDRLNKVESPQTFRDLQSQANQAVTDANKAIDDAKAAVSDLRKWYAEHPSPPIGAIVAFAAAKTPPTGWLVCNGDSLQRTEYPELFDQIGTIYGGTGSEFSLPDLQGYFLRGLDKRGTVDPDGKTRVVGSKQDDEFKSHAHRMLNDANQVFGYGTREGDRGENVRLMTGVDRHEAAIQFEPVGGTETRPKNKAVVWIMRVK